jgi:hypothetical protein
MAMLLTLALGVAGVCLNSCTNINDVQAPSCTYGVVPTAASFDRSGGTGTLNVDAAGVCAWTVQNSANWITVMSGNGGQGGGQVKYSVGANPTTAARVGTLEVAGANVTITQAATPCTYTVDPTSISAGAAASTGTVNVASQSGCAWTATSNVSWITVTSGASGSGSGATGYSIAANAGTSGRTGTLTVAGRSVSIVQTAASGGSEPPPAPPSPNCDYSLAPTSASFGSSGGTGAVSVSTGGGCSWTATSNVGWISITSGNGTGTGTARYSVDANAASNSRSGVVTIAGQAFTVTQSGANSTPNCSYSINPTSATIPAAGGTGSVAVTATAGCSWATAIPSDVATWVGLSNGSGTGNGSVAYTVAPNTGASRTGVLTIAGKAFTITQQQAAASCSYAVNPTSAPAPSGAGTGSISVTTAVGCNWTATSNASWITITAGASGSGNGTVQYSTAANPAASIRSGTLTVAAQTVTITQAAAPCTYTINPTSDSFGKNGGTGSVDVTTAIGCNWTAVSNASWLTITAGASGTGSGTVRYTVAGNSTGLNRAGTMTVAGQTFTVNEGK